MSIFTSPELDGSRRCSAFLLVVFHASLSVKRPSISFRLSHCVPFMDGWVDRQSVTYMNINEFGDPLCRPLGRAVGVRPIPSGRAAIKTWVLYSTSKRQVNGQRGTIEPHKSLMYCYEMYRDLNPNYAAAAPRPVQQLNTFCHLVDHAKTVCATRKCTGASGELSASPPERPSTSPTHKSSI